ncbi:MAG: exonuclease SbcCD subunit D [candidate division Zixibacteria bacterium]|nr:exonuclease SbcCD subunit D [candidate division Zixibacteria bacterium]
MPIKALHLADIHIGMENYGRIDPDTGLHTRLQDFVRCLRFVVDTALEEQIDLVLFSGDAYRTCDPNPTHQRELAAQFRRFEDNGIPVVMIVGNHDNPVAFGKASSIDIFGTLGSTGTTVVARPERIVVPTRNGPVQVACLPWPTKSNLLTKEQYKNLPETEVRVLIEDLCSRIIQSFADEMDPLLPSFLMAHIAATDARLAGTERSAVIGHDPTILTGVLANPAFDYVALGHIHKFQDLNPAGNPHVVYPGSIERVDFGEEHESCGFCIVEHETKGRTSFRFVATPARPFVTIEVDTASDDAPTECILREIGRHDLKEAVVRIIYSTPEDRQHLVDVKSIRTALEDAFVVSAIVRKTEVQERVRRAAVSEEMGLMDALDRYFENNGDLEPFADDMKAGARQLEHELFMERQGHTTGSMSDERE